MNIPTPLNYVLGFLLGMDAAGGGGIAIVGAVAIVRVAGAAGVRCGERVTRPPIGAAPAVVLRGSVERRYP